jgi:hypothetical protein
MVARILEARRFQEMAPGLSYTTMLPWSSPEAQELAASVQVFCANAPVDFLGVADGAEGERRAHLAERLKDVIGRGESGLPECWAVDLGTADVRLPSRLVTDDIRLQAWSDMLQIEATDDKSSRTLRSVMGPSLGELLRVRFRLAPEAERAETARHLVREDPLDLMLLAEQQGRLPGEHEDVPAADVMRYLQPEDIPSDGRYKSAVQRIALRQIRLWMAEPRAVPARFRELVKESPGVAVEALQEGVRMGPTTRAVLPHLTEQDLADLLASRNSQVRQAVISLLHRVGKRSEPAAKHDAPESTSDAPSLGRRA